MKVLLLISFLLIEILTGRVHTPDCSTPNYYENVVIDRQVSFVRDDELLAYTVEIPELCVKFISQPRNKELNLLEWKDFPELNEEKDIIVKDNSLFVAGRNYRFFDKKTTESLDETIQRRFRIRFEDDVIPIYKDQQYCIVGENQPFSNLYARPQITGIADENSHFTIVRQTDIDGKWTWTGDLEDIDVQYAAYFGNYDKWHCGTDYPIQEGGFGDTKPYGILYANTYPTRYFFYPEMIGHIPNHDIFGNIYVQYLD